ncbi:MAG: hypothetical protein JW797_08665 [Bradymonadales bacterium]|nr:hypothetical protein [Bradymonadales bacterium]
MKLLFQAVVVAVSLFVAVGSPSSAAAQEADEPVVLGLMLSAGGRYDNVRMCAGSPSGVPGGPAMDLSFFAGFGLSDTVDLMINLPVVRPLLFWLGFDMIQFEPSVRLTFDRSIGDSTSLVMGPVLGLTVHYGPDYESDTEGEARGPSFWAFGPTVGGYFGIDFTRPGELFNFQLGITPYLTPLFAIDDPEEHRGIVLGGMLEGHFRFHP